jgi:ABC-type glycerol-3-phosphate transport system permease component
MSAMSGLQTLLLVIVGLGLLLLVIRPKLGRAYFRYATLMLVGTLMMLPFVWLVCASVKDPDVINEYMFLPPPSVWRSPSVRQDDRRVAIDQVSDQALVNDATRVESTVNSRNFRDLWTEQQTLQGPVHFSRYIINSLFLSSAATTLGLIFSSMGGYAMAKYRFRGRSGLLAFMLASLTIPGVVLLAPNFEIIYRLGFMDTYAALLIPGCVSVFGIFLFRQAILGIPDDIIEAGRIDGAGEFRIYLTLIMPLVRPMTSAFCLITFLGTWNSFLAPNIFLQSQPKLPLPVALNQLVGVYDQQYGIYLAGTLIAIIPPAILFFALQREFISGLTSGSVKQ